MYDIVGKRRWFFALSGILILFGLGAMVLSTVRHGSPLPVGVDFTGGSRYVVRFTQPVSEEDVRRFQSDFAFSPPGGEARRSMNDRVVAFLEELPDRHAGETVLAVAHGGPLLALMYHVLGLPDGTFNRFYGVNGGLTEFERDRRGWRLVTFNERSYLPRARGR